MQQKLKIKEVNNLFKVIKLGSHRTGTEKNLFFSMALALSSQNTGARSSFSLDPRDPESTGTVESGKFWPTPLRTFMRLVDGAPESRCVPC